MTLVAEAHLCEEQGRARFWKDSTNARSRPPAHSSWIARYVTTRHSSDTAMREVVS